MEAEAQKSFKSDLTLVIFYHGVFGERFIANVMNYSNSCPSLGACGIDLCNQCKENVYNFSKNIIATFGMLDPMTMPRFIEDASDFLPKEIPRADLAVAINLHPDVLTALPEMLKESGFKGLIIPVEDPRWCPGGLVKQLKEKCDELGLDFAAPKPFCTLTPLDEHPTINRFIEEMGMGYPVFEIEAEEKNGHRRIDAIRTLRSEPCGAAWFIGVKLRGFEFDNFRELWNMVTEAHHSYPCMGSMERGAEYNEALLHIAGYVARHAVDKALGYKGDEDIPEHIVDVVVKE